MALHNFSCLVALRLCLHNVWYYLSRFFLTLLDSPCSIPCARQESYSTNLQGFGRSRPRIDLQTYKHRSWLISSSHVIDPRQVECYKTLSLIKVYHYKISKLTFQLKQIFQEKMRKAHFNCNEKSIRRKIK